MLTHILGNRGHKRGSSGAGITHFSPTSLRYLDHAWFTRVRVNFNQYVSYESLYRLNTQQIYPLPVRGGVHSKRSSAATTGNKPSPRNSLTSGGTGLIRGISSLVLLSSAASRKSSMDESVPSLLSTSSYQNIQSSDIDPDDPQDETLHSVGASKRSSLMVGLGSARRGSGLVV